MEELLALSKMWAEEHSCPAYYENEPSAFIDHEVYVACDNVDVIGVIATSYQYKKLLKFYIEELNMQFNHALLVKRTHQ